MKLEGIKAAPFRKRLFAVLINLLVFLLLSFVFDYTLMPLTYKRWMGHPTLEAECVELNNAYHDKQDEYGIYYYENDKRIYNKEVSEETMNNFKNDTEVRDIVSNLSNKQTKLFIIDFSSYGISFLLISFLVTVLSTFIFGKYKSIGALFMGIWTVNDILEKPKYSTLIGYAILRWFLLLPLGVVSIFMIPVAFLYQIYYKDDHRTKLEERFHLLMVEKD